MKTCRLQPPSASAGRGFALVTVLVFAGISLVALGGVMTWSSQSARMTARNIQYYNTLAAAEAATEKVLSRISADYTGFGDALVVANLASYRNMVPTVSEWSGWANYQFTDGQGSGSMTYAAGLNTWVYTNLASQYTGLQGLACTYRIISNASAIGAPYQIPVGVRQEVQLATVPIFQFAIFYSVELEINPGPNMTVSGRVHSNTNLFYSPGATLRFLSDVTAVGQILNQRQANDPSAPGGGTTSFSGRHDSGVSSLTLPIGTNNNPATVFSVIDLPPVGEDPASPMGKQRYYNKADMVVLVSDSTVTVTSGSFNSFATSIPWSQATSFIATNASFYNKREGKTVKATQIDVAKLISWSATNTTLRAALGGRDVSSIYVADQRTQSNTTEPGVRVVNGQTLPSLGLTVASKNPVYVQGNYNAPAAYLGTTNTTLTKPASLVGDAITVLSTAWNDANSSLALSSRIAANTTVNAAFLGGIVPTAIYNGAKQYSGGVENYPRFLEDWSSRSLTYNGSMVVMFYSQTATGLWKGTGSTIGIYNPPTRNWAFDLNFMMGSKLPPCTPQMRVLIRASWAMVAPNDVD